MRFRLFNRRAWYFAFCTLAVLPFVFLFVAYFLPWTDLSSTHQEIDINSGRVRQIRYLFWLKVDEDIRETWLSRAATPRAPAEWHRVKTSSLGRGHSPHYLYHSAVGQIDTLQMLNDLVEFTSSARARIVDRVLKSWQQGSDDAADEYVSDLSGTVVSMHNQGFETLTLDDLTGDREPRR